MYKLRRRPHSLQGQDSKEGTGAGIRLLAKRIEQKPRKTIAKAVFLQAEAPGVQGFKRSPGERGAWQVFASWKQAQAPFRVPARRSPCDLVRGCY